MFQSFESEGDPSKGAERIALLRDKLDEMGLTGFIVPHSDEHQGEYVAPCSERLRWLTGFAGSAGVALVLGERALIFVDGRYTLQVRHQADMALFTPENLIETPPHIWIGAELGEDERIGFDPWLHSISEARALRRAAEKSGAVIIAVNANPVDAVWADRPQPPLRPMEIHPLHFAGEAAKDKLSRLAGIIAAQGADHCVLSDPSSIAWAFNIRGSDVPHTPLALGFAIIAAKGPHLLFMDRRKLGIETKAYLTQLAELHDPDQLEATLTALAGKGAKVALDPALAADRLRMIVEDHGGKVVALADPARLPRAAKNDVEIAGTRAAHRRDGAAVVTFLAWLDAQPVGSVDEIKAVTKLEECRQAIGDRMGMPLRDISFDTIAGAGPNGAIVHYRVCETTNRKLGAGELFLLDSGAQYRDGTTDITRTMAIGRPDRQMCERATMVLKGMIAISMLRFPSGTRGCDIDAIARLSLWKHGLDYAHGTGHGVGSFLSVHEGPQRIAKTGTEKLLEGMILSNEPGYYRAGEYGIRMENLILVTPASEIPGGDIAMHGFETLTLAPFDRRLVVAGLLSPEELAWLNAYHQRVLCELSPLVSGDVLKWLEAATAPIN